MTRTDVLIHLARSRGYQSYLEIGYFRGDNFREIPVAHKLAVDPCAPADPLVIKATSDDFFALALATGMKFDLVFVDGHHERGQVLRDYANALACLNPGGAIVLHDVNPTLASHVRPFHEFERDGGHWTGDVYRAWCAIRRECSYWTATVPDEFGIGVVDTMRPAEGVGFDTAPETFEDFGADRDRFLNPVGLESLG